MRFEPFTRCTSQAALLPAANIDTDVIMPKIFLKGIDRAGLDAGVFHDLRFREDGTPNPDFVLNQAPWNEARFLVTGDNFGCGSSREHAVWGLVQLGIRAIMAPSFAGIFFDNCARNGLLAIELDAEALSSVALSAEAGDHVTVDLEGQTITTPSATLTFPISEQRKAMLLQGLDAIGVTLQHREKILAFEAEYVARNPWLNHIPEPAR